MSLANVSPRVKKSIVIAAVLYVLYALLGYFWLSSFIRESVEKELSALTGREVVLEEFVFNPLGLSVTATGFKFLDEDGSPFVAFDRFYADFELSSLFRLSWHFDDIELRHPRIQVTQTGQTNFNFDDLLKLAAQEQAQAEEQYEQTHEAQAAPLPSVSIERLLIDNGTFVFRDHMNAEPQVLEMDQLGFEITDFSTNNSDGDANQYSLQITGPEGGRFAWTGNMVLAPFLLEGQLELAGLELSPFAAFYKDRLNFTVPGGELGLSTLYRIEESADSMLVTLSDGALSLKNFSIVENDQEQPALVIPALNVSGVVVKTQDQSVNIANVIVDDVAFLAQQRADNMNWLAISEVKPAQQAPADREEADASVNESAVENAVAESAVEESDIAEAEVIETDAVENPVAETAAVSRADAEAGEAEAPWTVTLERLQLNNADIRYQDTSLTEPGLVALAPLQLTLGNLNWQKDGDFLLSIESAFNETGQLAVSGSGKLEPLTFNADITLESLPLQFVQFWARESANITIREGSSAATLNLAISQTEQDEMDIVLTGDSQINALKVNEADGPQLLGFNALALSGLNLNVNEQQVDLNSVTLNGLRVNEFLDAQGNSSAVRIAVPVSEETSVESDTQTAKPWHYRVNQVALNDGQIEFADQTQSPVFNTGLYDLNLKLGAINSRSSNTSPLTISAMVDRTAPLKIDGALGLGTGEEKLNLNVLLNNYQMTKLTPFTGRYVGYTVKQGQLGIDTDIVITGTMMNSQNNILADQFYLGDKVASEEAIKAPIKLGLAVLRDQKGEINLPVKAKGDLADPSVSVRGIVLKALGNVLVKAATSPFSMLGGLAGGGGDDDEKGVTFNPGTMVMDQQGTELLAKLAEVLSKRPQLNLQLSGSASAEDAMAIAEQALVEDLWGDQWPGMELALADNGFRRKINRAYKSDTEKTADDLIAPLADGATDDEKLKREIAVSDSAFAVLRERRMAEVPAETLATLAEQRVAVVKNTLVTTHAVAGNRVYVQGAPTEEQQPGPLVHIGLSAN